MAFRNKIQRGGDRKFADDSYLDEFHPLEVKVYGNFDRAFKVFKALSQKDKTLTIFKEKQAYEKPSKKLRRKRNENRKRVLEMEMKQRKILSGDYEKEKLKKLQKRELRKIERQNSNDPNL